MSIERVRSALAAFGAESRIREFPVSSATVALAAEALGVEAGRIAKSLAYRLPDRIVLCICAGDARVDNKRFRAFFQTKAKMLHPEEAEELVGHAVGGVCPFGVKEGVQIWLDVSLKRFERVYPAAGSDHSAVDLTLEELEKYSHCTQWVDVCKDWTA